MKVASVLEVSQSRDQNSDRVCNFTHVVSGVKLSITFETMYELAQLRSVLHVYTCNAVDAVETAAHVYVLGRIVKECYSMAHRKKCFSTARSLVSALACPTVMSFILL